MAKYVKKKNPKNKGGRPKIEFSDEQWKEFESLCGFQSTKLEICEWFSITDKTLDLLLFEKYKKSFSEVFKQKRTKGLISLRRTQYQLAQKSPAMAIFLGKNYLKQTDKPEPATSPLVTTKMPNIDNLSDEEIEKLYDEYKNNG